MALKAKSLIKFILFLNLFSVSCQRQAEQSVLSALGDKTRLTAALDIDMPGFFTIDGELFGYQYDLLKAYAEHNGIELDITQGNTPSEFNRSLKNGQTDITAGLPSNFDEDILIVPLYTTSYVMMARTKEAAQLKKHYYTGRKNPAKIAQDQRVMISSGFKATKTWDPLMDSMRTRSTYVSSRNCLELIEALKDGEYDVLICEKSEAQIGEAIVSGVSRIYEFEEQIEVAVGISANVSGLSENFLDWFQTYRESKEYAELNSTYFERNTDNSGRKTYRSGNYISEYDKVMKDVCEREGYDWRLMSAIAYNESRFNADIVSHRGAMGLMQIMPATARQFNIEPAISMEPEVNITLATKLLGKIESSLRFPAGTSYEDRMSIILACYNCGIGHVLDARRLAAKYGTNPNSWKDVSMFLQLKAEPEYNNDEVVKCGTFKGSKQTLAFVNNVMGRYSSYCSTVTR